MPRNTGRQRFHATERTKTVDPNVRDGIWMVDPHTGFYCPDCGSGHPIREHKFCRMEKFSRVADTDD